MTGDPDELREAIAPELRIYGQKDRAGLLAVGEPYHKTARIVAMPISEPFAVQTEHGIMTGEAGDYLATNHPADDPGSDIWPISAARMAATYQRLE